MSPSRTTWAVSTGNFHLSSRNSSDIWPFFLLRHLYRQTFGEEKGQKAHIKVEETEEQKAARVKEELKKLKVEEEQDGGAAKVKVEEGAEPMKRVVKKKVLRKKEVEEEEESSSEESSSSDDEEGGEKEVRLSCVVIDFLILSTPFYLFRSSKKF